MEIHIYCVNDYPRLEQQAGIVSESCTATGL